MEWARIRMKYFARVVALNTYVEEEITLSLGEYKICYNQTELTRRNN